jgi:hypothetical protein
MIQEFLTELERLSWLWKGSKVETSGEDGTVEGLDISDTGEYIARVVIHQEVVKIPLLNLELTSEGV